MIFDKRCICTTNKYHEFFGGSNHIINNYILLFVIDIYNKLGQISFRYVLSKMYDIDVQHNFVIAYNNAVIWNAVFNKIKPNNFF